MKRKTLTHRVGAKVRVRDIPGEPLRGRRGVVVRPESSAAKVAHWDTAVSIDGVHYWFAADELEADEEDRSADAFGR